MLVLYADKDFQTSTATFGGIVRGTAIDKVELGKDESGFVLRANKILKLNVHGFRKQEPPVVLLLKYLSGHLYETDALSDRIAWEMDTVEVMGGIQSDLADIVAVS